MHELLTPMLSDNRIDNITKDIFDHDRIGALSRDEYERLQNEFGLLAAPFVGAAPADYNFAAAVQDRFNNPFVNHELMSISLNSTSKWKARNMPSFLGCTFAILLFVIF